MSMERQMIEPRPMTEDEIRDLVRRVKENMEIASEYALYCSRSVRLKKRDEAYRRILRR